MYTLRITDENAIISTRESVLMEKSNCVDSIQIIANKLYQGQIDMSDATLRMEYVLPISHRIRNTILNLSEINEDNGLIYYKIPVTARIASEPGDIEVSFSFTKVIKNSESEEPISYVRKTQPGIIHITPTAQFESFEPSEYLTEIDQRMLVMEARQKDLQALSQQIYDGIPTDLKINSDEKKLTLINADGDMGNGVPIPELSTSIAEDLTDIDPDGTQDGVVNIDKIPNFQSINKLLKTK